MIVFVCKLLMYIPDALILLLCLSKKVYKYQSSLNFFNLLFIVSESLHDIFSVTLAVVKCIQAIVCLAFLQLMPNFQSSTCFSQEEQACQPGNRGPNIKSALTK